MSNRIIFTPSGREGQVADGATVLDAARQLGIDLDSVCGGRGICGRCQVVPGIGSFPKWGLDIDDDALSAPGSTEESYGGKRPLIEGHRLGCAAVIQTDVVIDIPESSQIHKQVIRKEVNLEGLTIDPVTELRYVEVSGVAPPLLLLRVALARDWDIEEVTVPATLDSQVADAIETARSETTRWTNEAASESEPAGLTVALRTQADGRAIDCRRRLARVRRRCLWDGHRHWLNHHRRSPL